MRVGRLELPFRAPEARALAVELHAQNWSTRADLNCDLQFRKPRSSPVERRIDGATGQIRTGIIDLEDRGPNPLDDGCLVGCRGNHPRSSG